MNLHIRHRTSYHYSEKVTFGPHQLLIRPREGHALQLEKFRMDISPTGHAVRWMRDPYENNVGIIDFTEPSSNLVIDVEFLLRSGDRNPFDFVIAQEAAEYPFTHERALSQELSPMMQSSYPRDEERVLAWLKRFWQPGRRLETLELLQQISADIFQSLRYQRREQKGVQSPAETLEKKSGSCRDFAALFIEACRGLKLAARFVSGYMYTPEITGRMSMHAWAEVYLPGAGWIGFDPSWGILASSQYVPVAVSLRPGNAPPISGTFFGRAGTFLKCEVDLYVEQRPPAGFDTTLLNLGKPAHV